MSLKDYVESDYCTNGFGESLPKFPGAIRS